MNKHFLIFTLFLLISCTNKSEVNEHLQKSSFPENLESTLDTIWSLEQEPLRKRDSLMEIFGVESPEAEFYQKIFRENHASNIRKVKNILDNYGWPDNTMIGEQGDRTICNVLQHSNPETREAYLPMMKQAVLDNKLDPTLLVRAEDRIATDKGEMQIYGGQMKYYPETKSFNVWPVYDPVNIDNRRAEIGVGPIAEYLKLRFDFEWDLVEQIERSKAFEQEQKNKK